MKIDFQTVGKNPQNRSDHVWYRCGQKGELWKCCLCGAICHEPPSYPTPTDWTPERYERLNDKERVICPYQPVSGGWGLNV